MVSAVSGGLRKCWDGWEGFAEPVEGHAVLLSGRASQVLPIWGQKAGICIHCNQSLLIHFS